MLNTVLAYKVFIMPTLLFLCQLEPPPDRVIDFEMRALRKLFKGPQGWMNPETLKSLKWLGFPVEIPDLATVAVAACLIQKQNDRPNGSFQAIDVD